MDQDLTCSIPHTVYGPQNVTSGASSDLRHATGTANAMVKVRSCSRDHWLEDGLKDTSKLWGYSDRVGPVYHNDRDDNISSKKREEIESEVRSCVVHFSQRPRFCISFGCLRVMGQGSDGKTDPGPLIPFSDFFRILKAGEKRASDLLKEKEVELHRVRNIRLLFPAEFLMVAFVDFSLMTLWRAKVGTCARGI